MKKVIFTSAVVLTTAVFGFGQKAKTGQNDDGSVNRQSRKTASQPDKRDSGSADLGSQLLANANIEAQLQKQLDVRTARVGDEVILKATKTVKQDGQVIIEKGSTLVGRITEVQQKAKGAAASKISLVFDQLRNGDMAMPITASIVSVAGLNSATSVGDAAMSDVTASSRTSGTASGSASGGGLLGGVGSAVGGLGSTLGGVANTATSTVGGAVDTTTRTAGSTTGTVGRTLSGIQISNEASGSVSGSSSIWAAGKDLRLEKGSTFRLVVNSQASRN